MSEDASPPHPIIPSPPHPHTPAPHRAAPAAFAALCAEFGATGPAVRSLYDDVVRRYGEDGRFYHTLVHVADVLATLDRLTPDALPVQALPAIPLCLAAWLHDVVYDPRAADNEARSAAYAVEVLGALGAGAALTEEVARLILCTQTHVAADAAAQLLLDADLAVLGGETAVYDAYARAIRREYAHVPDAAYRLGRAQVLRRFLARPRIFQTDGMWRERETAARANLARELAALTPPAPA